MSEYVVVDKEQLEADLTTVADSIRAKSGTTEDLAFPSGYKSVVESIDTSKEEQEKTISITENGTTEVIPDEGKVLSKVTVNVDVESGGGSGEAVGILLSDFTTDYNLPQKADLRSIPTSEKDMIVTGKYGSLFRNDGAGATQGFFTQLKEVYLPNGIYSFAYAMFMNCGKLTTIIGDLSKVSIIDSNAFGNCASLLELPYMPKLTQIQNNAFNNCKGLTSVKLYQKPSTFASAFSGCTNINDIYVPWSEGEVGGAPWGATNATIHYNTVYDENHNPIV